MAFYKYKASNAEGSEYEATKEFSDKGALYSALRKEGSTLLSVEEVKENKIKFHFSFRKGVKAEELISFTKNLAVMSDAGLPVSRALSILAKQSKNKKFITLMEDLISSINQGETLSHAMERHQNIFSNIFVSMVKAGEESGKLSFSLRAIASQLEKSNSLTKKVKGAMIYPAVIISLMVVIGIVLMVYMVPTLTATFQGLNIALPLPTRIIIAISDFLRSNIILTLLAIIGAVMGSTYFLKTNTGKNFSDYVVLHMPIFKTLSKEVNAARTSRTLSSLVSSGVEIVEAIRITSNVVSNHYFKNILEEAAKKVEVGELLSSVLSGKDSLYPIFVGEMLAVGEETGKMTDMLENIAVYYEGEVDQKTKDLSTIIEPFLMILIGVAVGAFAIAMLLPTYSLVDAIK